MEELTAKQAKETAEMEERMNRLARGRSDLMTNRSIAPDELEEWKNMLIDEEDM